jgi:hypothetical protein
MTNASQQGWTMTDRKSRDADHTAHLETGFREIIVVRRDNLVESFDPGRRRSTTAGRTFPGNPAST